MSLTIDTHEHGDVTLVTLAGELDLAAVPGFEAQLLTLISAYRCRLVIDLRKVDFCDSTGLSAFVRGDQTCAAHGGWLRVAGAHGSVLKALDITGLLGTLGFEPVRDGGDLPD